MKKLPLGIYTFADIAQDDYLYVDKTAIALDLIQNAKYYFLSRPRRFGKSLFLDTLKEIFGGSKELFKGLYIYDKWDFTDNYPVIKINFAIGFVGPLEKLDRRIRFNLKEAERDLGIQIETEDPIECLQELIWQAHDKYGKKVVVLVDEYDKLILDNLRDKEKARAIRDTMKGFYSVIKQSDPYLRFVFITGVSKFSKINLFSGLNNLNDITLDKRYGNICGYTHQDLLDQFGEHLEGVDMEEVRMWYNGYNFFGDLVYNPYDILLFIEKGKEFRNYWWSTGNPSFLVDLFKQKNYSVPQLQAYTASDEILDSFDIDSIKLEPLLWQTGYLTTTHKEQLPFGIQYKLEVPNKEIQTSLNSLFATALTGEEISKTNYQRDLVRVLKKGDLEGLKKILEALFASIAHNNYTNNNIAHYEGYYASVVYAYLASIGFPITPEDATNIGRIDLTLQLPDKTYIFEFKVVDKPTNQALQQIKERAYYEKYQGRDNIYLIGIEFGKEERNIILWETETILH